MGHRHAARDRGVSHLDQLCMIGFCGALGLVQILLYSCKSSSGIKVLDIILSQKFHVLVLISGLVLLCLSVVRGIALCVSLGNSGNAHDCCHDHDSAREDQHSHDHSHDCGHDHSWAPWRYVVLLLPILLFLVGLPWPADAVEEEPVEPGVMLIGFKDLLNANRDAERDFWRGKLVRVKGQYEGRADSTFNLFRWKMTCCRADAYRVYVAVVSPEHLASGNLQDQQWINATGTVTFEKRRGRDDYVTVLKMRTSKDIKPTHPDPTPYLQ
jgi:hypothetical protein